MIHLLDHAEAELTGADSDRLEKLCESLRTLPVLAAGCPADRRDAVKARLLEFQKNLARHGEILARGRIFLEGYSRRAGLSDAGYTPSGYAG